MSLGWRRCGELGKCRQERGSPTRHSEASCPTSPVALAVVEGSSDVKRSTRWPKWAKHAVTGAFLTLLLLALGRRLAAWAGGAF